MLQIVLFRRLFGLQTKYPSILHQLLFTLQQTRHLGRKKPFDLQVHPLMAAPNKLSLLRLPHVPPVQEHPKTIKALSQRKF